MFEVWGWCCRFEDLEILVVGVREFVVWRVGWMWFWLLDVLLYFCCCCLGCELCRI